MHFISIHNITINYRHYVCVKSVYFLIKMMKVKSYEDRNMDQNNIFYN